VRSKYEATSIDTYCNISSSNWFSVLPEITNTAGNIAFAQETARPEIGKILQSAGELFKSKKYKEALAKIHEADNVSGKTVYESFTIERMRASVANAAGDNETIIRSHEAIISAGKLPAAEQLKYIQGLASAYYKAANYPKTVQWINRYYSDGGNDPAMRPF